MVISDLHVGCRLGLCPPDGCPLDDGGRYEPSTLQRKVWAWWEQFWQSWVPHATKGESYAVLLNGDALEGVHHGATSQISQNHADQHNLAVTILRPVVKLCHGRYYHVRGTDAHAGENGENEEALARALDAVPNAEGQYARHELWIRVGPSLVHALHHIGTAGSMQYETSAPMRELAEQYIQAGRWSREPPAIIIRSHRHQAIKVSVGTAHGDATVYTSAAWQLKTPFAYRVAGARQAQPQIGGALVRWNGEEIFVLDKVWSMERPAEEVLHG